MDLAGMVVVVSGSSRGLGFAFAHDLAQRGARVVVNGVDPERCAAAASALGDRAIGVTGSVADEATVEALVGAATSAFGRLDAVVNNAGITRDGRIGKLEADAFDEVLAVHLRGTWLLSRAAVRAGAQSIVNITSGSSLYGLVGQSNYAAAKGGIDALTRALTVELGDRVRVNAVYPRAHTDMTGGVGQFPDIAAQLGAPEDVAPLVSYLVSPASAHVRGQLLAYDGTELTVWTHPAPAASTRGDLVTFLGDAANLQPLHPDPIGLATWAAFGAH